MSEDCDTHQCNLFNLSCLQYYLYFNIFFETDRFVTDWVGKINIRLCNHKYDPLFGSNGIAIHLIYLISSVPPTLRGSISRLISMWVTKIRSISERRRKA